MKKKFAPSLWQYVMDSSALINIERQDGIIELKKRIDTILIPEKVAEEVAFDHRIKRNDPLKKFVERYKENIVVAFIGNEEQDYLKIASIPGIDPGEAAAMAIALNRNLPLVIDERNTKATGKARELGIETLSYRKFLIGKYLRS